tara:strand:+ start:17616 stop:18767 length:1152 start_codon:yes stop_codon:yes gene_type:complete
MKKIILYISSIILLQNCSVLMPLKDLPKPDGKYIIGTDIFILEDKNRLETFTNDIKDYRKIIVQAWYPAIEPSDSIYPYLDYKKIKVPYIAKRIDISEKLIKHINSVEANSYYKAKAKNNEFPVIIFSHGLGGNRMQNTANIESLVSNGYIVFSIEHAYDANITVFNDTTFAEFASYLDDNVSVEEFYNTRIPQIRIRSNDISFLIDYITLLKNQKQYLGRISDINSIGVFGHSFGGGTAAVSSFTDTRIDACLALDGWFEPIPPYIIKEGINIPFLYIGQPQKNWKTAPYNDIQLSAFHNNNKNDSFIIEIDNTKHMDYSDIPYLTIWSRLLGLSGKDSKNITIDLNYTITQFFNTYLKNKDDNWLKKIDDNYTITKRIRKK